MSTRRPYLAPDVCEALGISLDTLYRTRELRHTRDGLPRPMNKRGPLKWERSGFDAWLTKDHPLRAKAPANDWEAPPVAASIEDHQAELHQYYREKLGQRA